MTPVAVKIKSYPITKKVVKQVQITLPLPWVKEMNLKVGDSVDLYRDTEDRLIITTGKRKEAKGS